MPEKTTGVTKDFVFQGLGPKAKVKNKLNAKTWPWAQGHPKAASTMSDSCQLG